MQQTTSSNRDLPLFFAPFNAWEKAAKGVLTRQSDKKLIQSWSKDNQPAVTKVRMPRAKSAASFVARVKANAAHGVDWLRELGITGAAARDLKEDDVTEELLEDWADIVEENNASLAKESALVEDWPERVT